MGIPVCNASEFLSLGMVNEIRIGNIIGINKIPKDFEILSGEKIITEKLFCDILQYKTIRKSIYPIPLTKEWLEKLGFELKNWGLMCWYFKGFEIGTDFSLRGIDWGVRFKYVHQLQNGFFFLTGEELVLKELAK